MKYVHTNIIAKDWRILSDFYINTFNCVPVPPERHLSGDWIDRLTALKSAEINGIHLRLPGYEEGPTLEIFEYSPTATENPQRGINRQGFGHIAFLVDSVEEILEKVIKNGGSKLGETVVNEYADIGTLTVVYAADPEGNFIEIQNWQKP
ncbi:MAG TPA: VOC family protein [Spirochaetota bacterium]|nr:VOC family protein [Spirochaetota bacterium]HPJ36013.1 VOC family protein [Spirochaetota bacterium]